MTMKNIFLSLLFVQILWVSSPTKSFADGDTNVNVYIHGHVFNAITGVPVFGQPVIINADIIQYSAIKLTNQNGFYQDSIPDVPRGIPIIVSVFDCNDSIHTQTVYSSETPLEVDFSICALAPCKANFTSRLDSNNLIQNTFIFTDSSGGHPDHWIWSFGDGDESHDQNPTHSYKDQGHYNVCLTVIKKDLSGGILCSDSSCSEIVTQSYYNLGGLVFAGLYPINNPYSTGDTGIAYLYRLHKSRIVPIDTITFTYLGYYAFLHLLPGSYFVKVGLKKGSARYINFLPVYSGDQLKWQSVSTVTIAGASSFSNNINLFQTTASLAGDGSIGGYVSHREKGPLLRDAEVILYNANLEPIACTVSDESGRFDFNGIGYGKYFLYSEITGKFAQLQEVVIDEGAPVVDGVVLEVSDLDFTGIGQWNGNDKNGTIRVFPNPFTDHIHIQIFSATTSRISVDIVNLTGMKIYSDSYNRNENPPDLTISLKDIPKGLYFLTFRTYEGVILSVLKIIKN